MQVHRSADHDRRNELVFDLTQDEIDDHDRDRQVRAAVRERINRGNRGGDDRADEGDDFEHPRQQGDRQRERQVEGRPEDQVHDECDEHDQEQLTAQPSAEDFMDAVQDAGDALPPVNADEPQRECPHPVAVQQEVEQDDQGQHRVQRELADQAREVQCVAGRPDRGRNPRLQLVGDFENRDRLAADRNAVGPDDFAEGDSKRIGSAS